MSKNYFETNDNKENSSLPKENKPYYCTECKRNHTKGKIYEKHYIFALFKVIYDKAKKRELLKEILGNEYKIDKNVGYSNDEFDDIDPSGGKISSGHMKNG